MQIAILETGAPPDALLHRHARYPQMMEGMLAPLMPRASFRTVRVASGEPPPPPGAFDGFLLTGSPAGVYDGHDWIGPLETFIRSAAALGRPQVGICFGHQIMAQAFGGRVEKSDKGWGVGLHAYEVSGAAPWMTPATARIACTVSHQDQVILLPPDGRALAGSAFCPNGLVAYGRAPAMSMQMHPEFAADFAADLYRARRQRLGEGLADEAIASLRGRSDRETLARWIAAFFLGA